MSINGLPLHPLVVDLVVVLLPIAVLGTLAVIAVPRWRRYTPVVAVIATVEALALPLTTQSGDALAERVSEPGVHEELGEQLLWAGLVFAALLWVLVAVQRAVLRRSRSDATRASGRRAPTLLRGVAALTVAAAIVTGVLVVRVGDTGAQAAWGDVVSTSTGDTD